ncbi:MAG TPA: NAD(P)/FAD-dependent oxidoreductase, partial [Pusillimonas sp.]|nr:NAD(P)/FAD-dependent oxidoreductase [Pusillimonas sp.]
GMPVVKGGGQRLVEALQTFIEQRGGQVLTGTEVESVTVSGSKATGVVANGQAYQAGEAVVCNVTPPQLYERLLPNIPQKLNQRAKG